MPRNKAVIEAQAKAVSAPVAPAPAPVPAPAPAAPKVEAKKPAPAAPAVPARRTAPVPAPAPVPQRPKAPAAAKRQPAPPPPETTQRPSDEATRRRLETWKIGRPAEERATRKTATWQPESVLSESSGPGTVGAGITQIPAGALIPNPARAGSQPEPSSPGIITYTQREPGGPWSAEGGYFQHPEGRGAMTPEEYAQKKTAIEQLELRPTSQPLTPAQAALMEERATGYLNPELRRLSAKARMEQERRTSEQRPTSSLFRSAAGTTAGTFGFKSGVKAAWPEQGMFRPSYRGVQSVYRSEGLRGVGSNLAEAGKSGYYRGAGWAGVGLALGELAGRSLELLPDQVAVPEEAMPPRPVRPDLFADKRVQPLGAGRRPGTAEITSGESGKWFVNRQIDPKVYENPEEFERIAKDYEDRYRQRLRSVEILRNALGPLRLEGAKQAQISGDPRVEVLERELQKLASVRTVLMAELGYTAQDLERITP